MNLHHFFGQREIADFGLSGKIEFTVVFRQLARRHILEQAVRMKLIIIVYLTLSFRFRVVRRSKSVNAQALFPTAAATLSGSQCATPRPR